MDCLRPKSVWAFGYGSLIWNRESIEYVEEKTGYLLGWHRDWTFISEKRRHGAPTCNLQPGGRVKGVFLRLDPRTFTVSLKALRKREGKQTENIAENLYGFPGETHFWTMGRNLEKFYETSGLQGLKLYRFLADIAKKIPEKGPDGKTAEEYAFAVYEFDPEDAITRTYVEELRKPS